MPKGKQTPEDIERQHEKEARQCERKIHQLAEAISRLASRPMVRRLHRLAEDLYALRADAEELYGLPIPEEIFWTAGELAEFLAEAPELPKYLPR